MSESRNNRRFATLRGLILLALTVVLLPAAAYAGFGDERCAYLGGSINMRAVLSGYPSGDFTVEAWARCDSATPANQMIVSKDDDDGGSPRTCKGFYIRVNGSGYAEAGVADGTTWHTVATSFAITQGRWNHYALVYSGTTLALYLNGVSIGTATVTASFSSSYFYVGRGEYSGTGTTYRWTGHIDEVRCWNGSRTQAEICDNMFKEQSAGGNLAHYYKLNGDSNDIYNTGAPDFGEGLEWVPNSAVYRVSGAFAGPKNGLTLDGSNDYISVADNASLDFGTGQYTIEFWIKGAAPAGDRPVIDHTDGSGGYRVEVTSAGVVKVSNVANSYTFTKVVMDDTWHHVVLVRNSGYIFSYVDGIYDTSSGNDFTGTASAAASLYIGRYLSTATYLAATLDEVRIWKTRRYDNDIRDNIFTNLIGTESNLVLYFRMDYGSDGQDNSGLGTHLPDQSSSANHGTLSANTSTHPTFAYSSPFNLWLGSESDSGTPVENTRWNLAGNWSRYAVPANTDNVGIYLFPSMNWIPELNSTTGNGQCRSIVVGPSITLGFNGSYTLDIYNHWIKRGTLNPSTGTLYFKGSATQYFVGVTTVYNLTLNNSGTSNLILNDNVSVDNGGTMTVTQGDIELNGKVITLYATATLAENTNGDCTVKGETGYIVTTRTVTGATPGNIGGMGLSFSGVTTDMGETIFYRRHAAETGIHGRRSIYRSFDVVPTNAFTATVQFWYDNSERNSISCDKLRLFKSTSSPLGSTWSGFANAAATYNSQSPPGPNPGIGYVTTNSISFGSTSPWTRVTLADMDNPLLVDLAWFTATPAFPPLGVVARWQTLSEIDNAGFYVWRAETPEGPWAVINPDIIPGRGNETTGALYAIFDDAVEPGLTYYYKLEDVDTSGHSTFYWVVPVHVPWQDLDGNTQPPPDTTLPFNSNTLS